MKAVLLREFGDPERLVYDDFPDPQVPPGGVRIGVRAAGINFHDTMVIRGQHPHPVNFPAIPGGEAAGDVLEVGAGVDRFQIGDRVYGISLMGCYAEQTVLPAATVQPIPDDMDYTTAACLGVAYGTGYYALIHRARLSACETLLVSGATGGAGLAAVEIGKALGATVIATGGSDEKLEVVAAHGADHVINYRTESIAERVKAIAGGADVAYEGVGGEAFAQILTCMNDRGRLLVVGRSSGEWPEFSPLQTLLANIDLMGIAFPLHLQTSPDVYRSDCAQISAWCSEGRLRPEIWKTFPLSEAGAAVRALIDRRATGKIVLTVD